MSTLGEMLLGRSFGDVNREMSQPPRQAYSEDQPRDSHGRFGEGGGTVERVDNSRGAIGVRRVEALQHELDRQGVPKDAPIRGVINHPLDQMAVARDKGGNIVGALAFSRDANGVNMHDFRAMEKNTGIGTAIMQHIAQEAMTTRGQQISAFGAVGTAVPFYQRMGMEFSAQTVNSAVSGQLKPGEIPPADKLVWGTYGVINPEAVKALADGHPVDKRETITDAYARTQREGGNPHFAYPGQPRDHGQFAEGKESETTGAPNVAHTSIVDKIASEGGISIQPVTGHVPTKGFMIAHLGGAIHKASDFFKDKAAGKALLKAFVRDHADHFTSGGYLGAWFDHEHNEVALDEVENFLGSREDAIALGQQHDQQAIFDLERGEDIPVGGTGGRQSAVTRILIYDQE